MAVTECVPAANFVDSVALPELSVPLPSEVLPSKKVTVPVAAVGDTVAVSVTLVPTSTEVPDAVSVTVLAWVPPDRFKKGMPPHPESASIGAVSTARRIRLLLLLTRVFDLICVLLDEA